MNIGSTVKCIDASTRPNRNRRRKLMNGGLVQGQLYVIEDFGPGGSLILRDKKVLEKNQYGVRKVGWKACRFTLIPGQ